MSTLAFCISRRKAERPAFLRVLKAIPKDRLDFRPEPKARTAGELAWLLAAEEIGLATLIDKGALDWKEEAPPKSLDAIVAAFEQNADAVDERLGRLDAAAWEKKAQFMMDGAVVWEDTLGNMVWGHLFDGVHHRGQLSTYLRPMGSKVPSIYGPSADDSGQ